jgi:hypothetical protein
MRFLSVWQGRQLREKVLYPAPIDNFSIGLFGVAAGDYFDVRELSMFVGFLPSED